MSDSHAKENRAPASAGVTAGPSRGGRPRVMGAVAQRRFLDAVRRGERLDVAAKAGGFALSAFYWRRKRDPGFDSDWDDAVLDALADLRSSSTRQRSGQAPGVGKALRPGSGQAVRRPRFTAWRRAAYLDHLATCCDTTAAAAAAGVHRSAVYRRIARDPDFARDNEAALERGYERLEIEARREREEAAARAARWREIEPTGRPTLDYDEQMRLLARYSRPARPPGARPRRTAPSFDESLAALEVKLSRMDIPPL